MVRAFAFFLLACAALLIAYGVFALRAGEASAAHGGGIMSGFGFIPIGLGLIVGSVAVVTLIAVRISRSRREQ